MRNPWEALLPAHGKTSTDLTTIIITVPFWIIRTTRRPLLSLGTQLSHHLISVQEALLKVFHILAGSSW